MALCMYETKSCGEKCNRLRVDNPRNAVEALGPLAAEPNREMFVALYLDTKNHLLGEPYVVSIGSLNASIVHPRESFREAIQRGAARVIFSHNHPSGHVEPSAEDIVLYRRLATCGSLLGINMIDGIITAPNTDKVYSAQEAGELL